MGSLTSRPWPVTPPPTPEPAPNFRVYLALCEKESYTNCARNWIECYTPFDNTWSFVSEIPVPSENHVLKDFAMVCLGSSIYIIGGRLFRKEKSQESDQFIEDYVDVLSTVFNYNIPENRWSQCASLGTPRYNFACIGCDNKIYAAGGQRTLSCPRGISSAEVYDPDYNEWSSLPNMSTLRYKCVGVKWHDKIHVVGGFAMRGDDADHPEPINMFEQRSSAEVFDPRSSRWEFMAKMWQLDCPPNQIVALGGRLFSSGDCLNVWKGHIESYDEELNMWNVVDESRLATLSSPVSTSNANRENWPPYQKLFLTIAPIGTYLYFFSGYRMAGELPRTILMVHRFDTSATSSAWMSFDPTEMQGEKQLCSHCCVAQLSQLRNGDHD